MFVNLSVVLQYILVVTLNKLYSDFSLSFSLFSLSFSKFVNDNENKEGNFTMTLRLKD